MQIISTNSIIGVNRNPYFLPKKAVIINSYYELWFYNDPVNPILNELYNLSLVNNIIDKQNIEFGICDFNFESRIIRCINNNHYDNINYGILIVYNQYENELAYFLIKATPARYNQIIFLPFKNEDQIFKYHRNKFLFNKFKRFAINIGKIIKFIYNIYIHVHYKPEGVGYFYSKNNFYSII